MLKIYVASKMHHADKWRELYSHHPELHFVNNWPFLEPFIEPTPENSKKFWIDDFDDIQRANVVLVYAEGDEKLRGALVEAGMGIALGKIVVVVGNSPDYGSWQYHPAVMKVNSFEEAIDLLHSLNT